MATPKKEYTLSVKLPRVCMHQVATLRNISGCNVQKVIIGALQMAMESSDIEYYIYGIKGKEALKNAEAQADFGGNDRGRTRNTDKVRDAALCNESECNLQSAEDVGIDTSGEPGDVVSGDC